MGVRWECPTCGRGAIGPERPRLNASVRYCLGCSASSPTLVERVAPALERRRAQRQATLKAKAVRAREREAAAEARRYSADGVDLRVEARRLWNLAALRAGAGWRQGPPPLAIRRRSSGYSSGHAHYGWEATVTAGTDAADAVATVLHELVHLAHDGAGRPHGAEFHRMLMAAAREAWPTVTFGFADVRPGGDAYAPDFIIATALRLAWAEVYPPQAD